MEFFKKRRIIVARRKLSHLGLKSPKVECVGRTSAAVRQGRAAPAGGGGAIDFSGCVLSSRENNRLDDTVATITESCDPILLPETCR